MNNFVAYPNHKFKILLLSCRAILEIIVYKFFFAVKKFGKIL